MHRALFPTLACVLLAPAPGQTEGGPPGLSPLPGDRAPAAGGKVDFSRTVRPILSNHCFKCHGPDARERKGGLRLDLREEALAARWRGKAVLVPGKPEESALLERVLSGEPKVMMPPPEANRRPGESEKEALRQWIAQGAEYAAHWSFAPPRRPPLPEVRDRAWPRGEIDRFILARLEAEGLRPSPEAPRTALIRRLSLDLTGLPPTPVEVEAFLADPSPTAYEALVDRLLASPHHGERMAMEWLDVARFADTHGYHIDSGRDMTRWREWVIQAFNGNLPFDRFTVEQLAGDLLPQPTLEQRIATGFHRNHMINFEGGAIPEEYLTAYIVDRVNTTGTVWLGLTVGCAQCHDHKYDPVSQKEYYGLYAFFNTVPENGLDGQKGNAAPAILAPRPEERAELERLQAAAREAEGRFRAPDPELDNEQAAWEEEAAREKEAEWTALEPVELRSEGGAELVRQADGSILASGPNPAADAYTVAAPAALGEVTALRLEALPDDRLPAKGPGRSPNGNLVLTGVRLELAAGGPGAAVRAVKLAVASASFSQKDFPVEKALDGDARSGWALLPQAGKANSAVFEAAEPLLPEPAGLLRITLEFRSQFPQHALGRFRLLVTGSRDPHGKRALPSEVRAALALAPERRAAADRDKLREHFRGRVSARGKALLEELERRRKEKDGLEKGIPTAMVMQDMEKPRPTHLLLRGQYDKHGDRVEPGVPAFLPPLEEGARRDRLALARWLVDPAHPLTARVAANRFWQMLFGTGLVKTPEDFGSQGEPPSHPELLDWLAVEWMSPSRSEAGGEPARPWPKNPWPTNPWPTNPWPTNPWPTNPWNVKRLIRLLVTSATYRQSSAATPALLEKDPENRLLGRGPRLRLPAELIRDQALAVSGLLNREIGGKSVSPYQPPGLWEELASREDGANWTAQTYVQGKGKELYRRSMYTFWKRTSPPPSLTTFDAPDRETCTVRRPRTNTPLQALVLWNDPTYVEASRKLAERMMREGGADPDSRIAFAFRLATARLPSRAEAEALRKAFRLQQAAYRGDPAAALRLLSVGEAARDEGLDPVELAAWTLTASAILNLDETLCKG